MAILEEKAVSEPPVPQAVEGKCAELEQLTRLCSISPGAEERALASVDEGVWYSKHPTGSNTIWVAAVVDVRAAIFEISDLTEFIKYSLRFHPMRSWIWTVKSWYTQYVAE
jgi:hypothetical protein